MVDFPGGISCVIFVGSCNFRCPFCHNPHLVLSPETQPELSQDSVLNFLSERRRKIDAVVLSGGEPTMRPRIGEFMRLIKEMGFHLKLDTNGTNPGVLSDLHDQGLIDSLGMDFKAHRAKYHLLAGRNNLNMIDNVFKSFKYASEKKIPSDVRTTVHRALLDFDDLVIMRRELNEMGIREWTLQQFHPVDVIDRSLVETETFSDQELLEIAEKLGNGTRTRGTREASY